MTFANAATFGLLAFAALYALSDGAPVVTVIDSGGGGSAPADTGADQGGAIFADAGAGAPVAQPPSTVSSGDGGACVGAVLAANAGADPATLDAALRSQCGGELQVTGSGALRPGRAYWGPCLESGDCAGHTDY